ncbi:hypothetical protein, partial [Pseudolysinimonas sp.]|uniref:hypothetical protein n=1 Tax=Pseudolysinimonas sp. TaxID=2680009 RepID=UPI00286B96B1
MRLVALVLTFALGISAVPVASPPAAAAAAAAAATISGRVTMPDGSPIDANVRIAMFTDSGWYDEELALDNDGTFSLTPWGPDEFLLRLSYQGTDPSIAKHYYLPGTLVPEEAEPIVFTGTSIQLDLPLFTGGYGDASTISGRVLTTEGDGLETWLDVIACPVDGGDCAEVAAPPHYYPQSGEFTIVLPGPGEYTLCFEPRPLSDLIASCWSSPAGDTITVGDGEHVTGITASVVMGGRVKGKVIVRLEPGGPLVGVVGAVVQLYRDEDGPDAEPVAEHIVTEADGSFSFSAVPPGEYAIYADTSNASDDLPTLVSAFYVDALTWDDRTVFEVESGETTPWLYLPVEQPFGQISGTVGYDDDG